MRVGMHRNKGATPARMSPAVMSAFMIFATALTLSLAAALSFLVCDAIRCEARDELARMRRRSRVLRLPTVISRNYVGVDRRRAPRAVEALERRAA
ncbi:hypothetical protein GCM10008101_20250 [Lysobacter xinjiangensis]|uniref:Uncharacterized protein n=2 Tax=Cognatilysobacter xinjiangensis TaxID=546892 RepID=A0ABQ3C3F9_9GAMM|nr:hypothetical protein GCM10008101_20250 [Lysobacter xinjiangensis]